MAKISNGSRDFEDRNEEERGPRINREVSGSIHSKIGRGGREIRSRGEGSNGARRREKKTKVRKIVSNETSTERVNVSRVDTKQPTVSGNLRAKSLEKPFIKIINEKGVFNQESVLKILSDLPGHFVIGVCGPQGVGKSTVISTLCQDPQNAFTTQSIDTLNFASHETIGIDIHVTPERIILLDAQPLFSLSILEHAIRNDFIPDNMSPELWLESQYRIPEFPTIPSLMSADSGVEYYPDIDFTTSKFKTLHNLLSKFFKDSNLKIFGSISMSKSFSMFKHESDLPSPNLFLLPYENQPLRLKQESVGLNYLNAPDTFFVMAESLRNQIFQLPKRAGKKGQVSEKEWFKSSMKIWDMVRKSEFLSEYGKLSQKVKEM
ncbi:9234_t:CDS:2 [Diversispora eburnea]|uniref:9234_t:CDS:1 n=1 Tax=Diversispora eburnea TaxID=1213867 RepID=A0A9N9BDI5_9GLOM|nr:9234_t:CDS:2 [Diversispora eburnea]